MSDPTRAEQVALLTQLIEKFSAYIALNKAMGIENVGAGDGWAVQRLPYDERLVGDPESGVLHGGAISTLLDSCCGAAAFLAMEAPQNLATLDLRIDYLRPATPGLAVTGRAECFRRTRQVAFIRCVAYHDDPEDAIAIGSASFVIGTPQHLKGRP